MSVVNGKSVSQESVKAKFDRFLRFPHQHALRNLVAACEIYRDDIIDAATIERLEEDKPNE